MKMNWLVTTTAVALLASTGLASAQGMGERGGKSSGAVEKSAPAPHAQQTEKNAQTPRGQMKNEAQQQQQHQQKNRAQSQDRKQERQTTGQSTKADHPSGQSDRQQKDQRTGREQNDQRASEKPRNGQSPKAERQNRPGADADNRKRSETTGKGDAKGVSLSTEQRTKIRKVIVSKKIPQVAKVNFSVTVGAKVPRTVHFYPIPVEIVEIHPAWRGYQIILVGSELVIINPTTFEIVSVVVV